MNLRNLQKDRNTHAIRNERNAKPSHFIAFSIHLERFLDLLYCLFSDVYTMAELHQVRVSDPFDRSDHPRQLRLVA